VNFTRAPQGCRASSLDSGSYGVHLDCQWNDRHHIKAWLRSPPPHTVSAEGAPEIDIATGDILNGRIERLAKRQRRARAGDNLSTDFDHDVSRVRIDLDDVATIQAIASSVSHLIHRIQGLYEPAAPGPSTRTLGRSRNDPVTPKI
jgi:hypothetical protein